MSGAAKNGIMYVYADGGSIMRLAGGLWNNNYQIAFNWISHYVYEREGWDQHRYHDVELSDPPILLSFFVFFPQFYIIDTLWVQSWESSSSAWCFHMAVAMNGSKGVFSCLRSLAASCWHVHFLWAQSCGMWSLHFIAMLQTNRTKHPSRS